MCTAATYQTKDFYMGRTLDYEFSYGEQIAIVPRNYPIKFHYAGILEHHYACIGMAHVANGYPLYYDAANEKGLGMAGLNFVGNAAYADVDNEKENVAQYEFIPWILTQCATVEDAKKKLKEMNLTGIPFSAQLPTAQLHWIIADKDGCIVVESMADGLHVYDNPAGVLTNNPPFPQQMFLMNQYMNLSSTSRFARVAFTRLNSRSEDTEKASVSQFFHILGSVDQQRGCCEVAEGKYEITIYTSCCNTTKGIYYYTTYENPQITAVNMHATDLNGTEVVSYPMLQDTEIRYQN